MKKRSLFLLIFTLTLTTCTSPTISITPTIVDSLTPKNSATVSTPTSIPTDISTPVLLRGLEPRKDYIFYISTQDPKGISHELWGIEPASGETALFARGIDWLLGWSHPSNKWLLSTEHALYIANSDGSNLQKIYEDQNYTFTYSYWLSDHTILINAYSDLVLPPQFYIFDLMNGHIEDITSPDDPKFVEVVSPLTNIWIQAGWNSGTMQINDLSGHIRNLFDKMQIRVDHFDLSNIGFLPDGENFIFIARQKETLPDGNQWKLFLASTTGNELKTLFEAKQNSTIQGFRVSPNGQYVAFLYATDGDRFVNFLNLQTQHIDYQWVYPYWPGSTVFRWSPDSKSIVLPYVSSESGTIPEVLSGIQIMNITNGETQVILSKNVEIVDWYLLK